MRRLLRPLWIALAVAFLVEAWLWDHLRPIVAAAVGFIPWDRLKAGAGLLIAGLSPQATLGVFVIPVMLLIPVKLAAFWLFTCGAWFSAIAVLVFAKLLGLGVTAFVFDVCRTKLLQMAWFRRIYEWVLQVRAWAHVIVDPIAQEIRNALSRVQPPGIGRYLRMIGRIRGRMRRPHPHPPQPVI